MTAQTFVHNIRRCARCGEDHPDLEFRLFSRSNPDYQRWALCPTTGEPILMQVRFR